MKNKLSLKHPTMLVDNPLPPPASRSPSSPSLLLPTTFTSTATGTRSRTTANDAPPTDGTTHWLRTRRPPLVMTDSPEQRRGSHYMTNIAPQVSSFNQGIWENTEDIEACYRNLQRIYTWGGILYTDDSNDYFLDSHGIRTPDFWWKVVLTKDDSGADKIISWFFPNQENLGTLDSYLVSVADIEARLTDGLGAIPVPTSLKGLKVSTSWPKPADCTRRI